MFLVSCYGSLLLGCLFISTTNNAIENKQAYPSIYQYFSLVGVCISNTKKRR